MRTWEDYKNHVKAVSEEERRNMEEIEEVSDIVSSIIRRRQELGISQRALAERCGIPQSSVARIETLKTTPKPHKWQNKTVYFSYFSRLND